MTLPVDDSPNVRSLRACRFALCLAGAEMPLHRLASSGYVGALFLAWRYGGRIMTHLPPPSGDGDRSSLDEALFGGDFPQPQRGDVPDDVALSTVRCEPPVPPLPAPLVGVPVEWPDEPPPGDP